VLANFVMVPNSTGSGSAGRNAWRIGPRSRTILTFDTYLISSIGLLAPVAKMWLTRLRDEHGFVRKLTTRTEPL
jgi:hypothetical protein